jgi:predicted metal-dependent HD superfamily phosphohydrolase
MKGYRKIRTWALTKLENDLPEHLTYHGAHHTQDVLKVTNAYIRRVKPGKHNAYLLRIAALTHDIGFTISHENHEETGAKITGDKMEEFGFSTKDIKKLQSMIMSTKVPQNPKTELEKILCDADLDYLGRKDFFEISQRLYEELQHFNVINSRAQWMKLQSDFFESHRYHTNYARKFRAPVKAKWLEKIRAEL